MVGKAVLWPRHGLDTHELSAAAAVHTGPTQDQASSKFWHGWGRSSQILTYNLGAIGGGQLQVRGESLLECGHW